MTPLRKEIDRQVDKEVRGKPVIITLIPGTDRREAMIALRLKGERTEYRGTISDLYRTLALWHGNAERQAKAAARKQGVPWRTARKAFLAR